MARERKKVAQKNGEMEQLRQEQEADDDGNEVITEEKEKAERTKYEPAPDPVNAIIRKVMLSRHKSLVDEKVTVNAVVAKAGKNGSGPKPAITEQGYAVDGKITRSNAQQRMAGAADVQIAVDWNRWEAMSPMQREALIDEQLRRIALKREGNTEDGAVQYDDANRPKLIAVKFDTCLKFFNENIAQYQTDSPKHKQIAKLAEDFKQLQLFGENRQAVG